MFEVKFADFIIEGIQTWTPSRKNKVGRHSLPRRHGTLIPDVAFSDELIINLAGEVWRNSLTELRDYFDDLGARLINFGKDRLYLADDGRFVYAICSGTGFPAYDAQRSPAGCGRFSLEFTCGDPFWYSASEAEDHQTPGTSPFNWSITNNGKMRTPLRIHITPSTAAQTDMRVTNTTTGLFMRYRSTVKMLETVVLDAEKFTCINNAVNDLNQFEGSFFLLEIGQNNLTYAGGTPVTIDTYWRERYAQ